MCEYESARVSIWNLCVNMELCGSTMGTLVANTLGVTVFVSAYITLQHTAAHSRRDRVCGSCIHCNTLQHTATYSRRDRIIFAGFCMWVVWEWQTSTALTSHVIRIDVSCHTYEWVMSHIWMRDVTRIDESCQTCQCVMSHIWMRHVAHINESCKIYEWVALYL